MLPSILARATKMPVLAVTDEMQVKPNTVYVIPSGKIMTLKGECLNLIPKGASLKPIDAFFISLAQQRSTQAIGIVLSGTGTDGTEGLKEIKNEGGITFAQDPKTAQYTGMPQSVISSEAVDFILAPDQIAHELSKIANNPQLVRAELDALESKNETILGPFIALLKSNFKVDFSHYKESFLNRRIKRRIVLNHMENIKEYSDYLHKRPDELQKLFDDLLVGVTNFFREPNTFTLLKEKVFPEIVKNKSTQQPIRVWVIGCSSGEEAYSFAITLLEFLEEKALTNIPIQIFGTDVNQRNIDKARQGIYPKTIESNVSEQRLKKHFTSFNGSYRISKGIRDLCVFSKQDVTADPPFSNLDLVSCRNMLIYFDSPLQERVVPILHYALKPNGCLVLGESESIGKLTALFEPQTSKGIIYVKKKAHPQVIFGFETFANQARGTVSLPEKRDSVSLLREAMDKVLLTDFVPASLLVNNNLDTIITRGNVAPYLKFESGEASLNLAKMLRKEVRAEAQTLLYRAKKENKPIKSEAIRFEHLEHPLTVNIQVIPLKLLQYEEPFFLVLFEDVSSAAAHLRQAIELTSTPEGRENAKDAQIQELREEADSTKHSLQTIIESQESSNEELKASMEEIQSTSEELQSTNEELETAKEELQSSNEELTTLNDELKNRNQTISILNADLTNISENVDSAVVLVDGNLKIRLFNPAAEKILKLIPEQIGLPIASVSMGIIVEDLEKNISESVAQNSKISRQVRDRDGRMFELRVRPYFIDGDRVDGAVLAFIDVDELEKTRRLATIGATAGMVGHDIRNPLQAITGDVYLLEADLASCLDSEQKKEALESLKEIGNNVDYINKIVVDLQDYARPLKPVAKETNLETVIENVLLKFNLPRDIKTSCYVEKHAQKIVADPDLLKRIMGNLVTNAVQAMPNGGKLSINVYSEENAVVLTIEDNGVGIPEEVKPKLFTPLFTTKSKGQGFGLAVVKRITEALGGTITFESQNGKGTKFIIRFPAPNS